jgi:hypothetical protein
MSHEPFYLVILRRVASKAAMASATLAQPTRSPLRL